MAIISYHVSPVHYPVLPDLFVHLFAPAQGVDRYRLVVCAPHPRWHPLDWAHAELRYPICDVSSTSDREAEAQSGPMIILSCFGPREYESSTCGPTHMRACKEHTSLPHWVRTGAPPPPPVQRLQPTGLSRASCCTAANQAYRPRRQQGRPGCAHRGTASEAASEAEHSTACRCTCSVPLAAPPAR